MASKSRRIALLCGRRRRRDRGRRRRAAAGVPLRRQGRQGRLLGPLAAHRFEGSPGEAPVAQFHREQRRRRSRSTQASERFPVTLYTFACGAVCENAEGLLNRRGVPFTTVNVEDAKGAEQLKKLTGEQQAPVLQIGDKLIAKGFNEARWTAMLDEAGYPKSAPRRVAAKVPAGGAAGTCRRRAARRCRCPAAATRRNSAAATRVAAARPVPRQYGRRRATPPATRTRRRTRRTSPDRFALKLATWNVNSLNVRLPRLVDWLARDAARTSCACRKPRSSTRSFRARSSPPPATRRISSARTRTTASRCSCATASAPSTTSRRRCPTSPTSRSA